MPYRGGTPQTAVDNAQYSGSVSWETEAGQVLEEGVFGAATAYRAVVALTPKEGFTFSGLSGDSFTCSGAQSVTFDLSTSKIAILFSQTAAAGVDEKITLYDLTSLIPAPVYRGTPVGSFESEQYAGAVVWYYAGETDTPIGDAAFDSGKTCKAVVTLTAKSGFTITGVPANAFTHADSTGASNAAGSAAITLTFAGAAWAPSNIIYPSLSSLSSDEAIKICCYPSTNNSGAQLLANSTLVNDETASGFWDYGWNGEPSSNFSDWAAILKDAEGVTFNGDECGQGHSTVFLGQSMPEAIRKRAHCFTLDLGEVTNDIVSFGIYPRTNEKEAERGQRWPTQFEVFYSDTEIGAIPGAETASLGIFEWGEVPYPWAWRDAELYKKTNDGKGISARYIHVRVYAEAKNGFSSEWVCPSFAGIRIGVDSAE